MSDYTRLARAPLMRFNRRRLLQGLGAGAFVLGTFNDLSWGEPDPVKELSGTQFDLRIGEMVANFTGQDRRATVVNGQIPAPLLRLRQGDTVTLRVSNLLKERSSIHWHGMIVPADMDGVPGLSFEGIPPDGSYTYRFKVNQYGTYWYHAHSRFQEQTGLYGPIVIERAGGERFPTDRDYVILLSDWTDTDPDRIFSILKKHSSYFNFRKRTAADFFEDVRTKGWQSAVDERRMWNQMRMNSTDLADVSGYAYTYLMNGLAPLSNWTGLFSRGEKVRLRFINGSSMSIFDVQIPGLTMTVVAADGQDVEPITIDEFRITPAETYDVIVEPSADSAYTIFAQSIDRSGFARGTLAPQLGMQAEIPALDPRPVLTMMDMGMAHDMAGMEGTDMSSMDHSSMDMAQPGIVQPQHAASEYRPSVDMRAARVRTTLDDPGVGLRENGRRVLTYADLHTIGGPIDHRDPGREIVLHLTGHMERFIWSFNGQKFSEAEPLKFRLGERLKITLVNDSMMIHPIHLHGMWSEVLTPTGGFQVRKHTVMVQPAQQVSYAVTADALGRWAYHCHLLYHMEAGMFREVHVEDDAAGAHS